jgi:hypothetical protein
MKDETPYTVAEVSRMLAWSPQMITRMFENEPGVVIVKRQGPKRAYRSIRIPRHVYERVIRKLSVQ